MKISLVIANILCVIVLGAQTCFYLFGNITGNRTDRSEGIFPLIGVILLALSTILIMKGYYPKLSKELSKLKYEAEILKKQVEIRALKDKLGAKGE